MLEQMKSVARGWLGQSPDEGVADSQAPSPSRQDLTDISLEYSFEDLSKATKGFAASERLGAGAAGAVYKGTLRSGTQVAVKVLLDAGGLCGFEDEVRVLSRFRHPNLVTLLGWGHKDGEKYLVYELMMAGDVSEALKKSKKGGAQFTWSERLRVAYDSARGLSHMVNSDPKAFHRDIKPANILCVDGGGAKMADFGLASTMKGDGNHLTVEQISGTPGYACPMYIQTGHVSEQSEVYSFGIVLLELLLNEPPALAGPQGDIVYPLLAIVQPNVPGAHNRVLQRIDRTAAWPGEVVADFADHAISCVHMIPSRRPTFETVVKFLRNLINRGAGAGPGVSAAPPLGSGTAGMIGMGIGQNAGGYGGYGGAAGRPAGPGGNTPPQAHASAPPYRPSSSQQASSNVAQAAQGASTQQLAEVILDAEFADGVDVSSANPAVRALAFAVEPAKGRCSFAVGRTHQPDFFEKMVLRQEQLHTISRSHFEICWEAPATAPTLKKLSQNALILDDSRPLSAGETVGLQHGSRLGFTQAEGCPSFLVLRVALRGSGNIELEGPHPALAAALHRRSSAKVPFAGSTGVENVATITAGSAALLECEYSIGGDPTRLPPEMRSIPIPLDQQVDIGRSHQPQNFFEQLLHGDSRWLNFISRSHCRVLLHRSSSTASGYGLRIENLSNNAVYAKGQPLAKGRSETLAEYDKITFVANPGGPEGETRFLEFVLRRARPS